MNSEPKLSDADKLAMVREYKDKGNAAYKEGKYTKAVGCYHRAILYLKGLSMHCPDPMGGLIGVLDGEKSQATPVRMSASMIEEANALTCDCYNNLAASMLKDPAPKYNRIIEHCDKALEASPNNAKALFRRGISLYELQNYEEALKTFEKAPPDTQILKYRDLCKAGIKKQEKELAHLYKGMFQS